MCMCDWVVLDTYRAQEFPLVLYLNKAVIHLKMFRSKMYLHVLIQNWIRHNRLPTTS